MKILVVIYLVLCTVVNGAGIKDRVEKEIKGQFKYSRIEFSNYKIPAQIKYSIEKTVHQKFFKNKIYFWKIFLKDKLNAIALLDNVYGKTMPITFIVIFDMRGNIIGSSIIQYREAHGGEVESKNWLSQFYNKNSSSSFEFGTDIDGISGATISAKSVTKGIQKLSLLVKKIIDKR